MRGQEEVAGQIAELAGTGSRELRALRRIQVPQDAVGRIGKCGAIATAAAIAVCHGLHYVTDRVGSREHGERTATGDPAEAGDLPAADGLIHEAPAIEPVLTLAERKLHDEVRLEHMAPVEIRVGVVQLAIPDVERRAAGG